MYRPYALIIINISSYCSLAAIKEAINSYFRKVLNTFLCRNARELPSEQQYKQKNVAIVLFNLFKRELVFIVQLTMIS